MNYFPAYLSLSDNSLINLFSGMNLVAPLTLVNASDDNHHEWTEKIFENISQRNKRAECIKKYNPKQGKWQATYPFFGQIAGPMIEEKDEGYVLYLSRKVLPDLHRQDACATRPAH